MTYETCEAAIQAQLQLLTSYFDRARDVSLGDWSIRNDGSAPYAIIEPGPFTSTPVETYAGASESTDVWTIYVVLSVKFEQDSTVSPALVALRSAVINQLLKTPYLGGVDSVTKVVVKAGSDIYTEAFEADNDENDEAGPDFLTQVLTVEVSEFNVHS